MRRSRMTGSLKKFTNLGFVPRGKGLEIWDTPIKKGPPGGSGERKDWRGEGVGEISAEVSYRRFKQCQGWHGENCIWRQIGMVQA